MKFLDMPYKRPDLKSLTDKITGLTQALRSAPDFEKADEAFLAIQEIYREFKTLAILARIRHDIDTAGCFLRRGKRPFFDDAEPEIQQ